MAQGLGKKPSLPCFSTKEETEAWRGCAGPDHTAKDLTGYRSGPLAVKAVAGLSSAGSLCGGLRVPGTGPSQPRAGWGELWKDPAPLLHLPALQTPSLDPSTSGTVPTAKTLPRPREAGPQAEACPSLIASPVDRWEAEAPSERPESPRWQPHRGGAH